VRREIERALTWVLVVGGVALAVYIAQPLLIIFGALVFACLIDGGARLLGRIVPLPRGVRVGIVCLVAIAFLIWLGYFATTRLSSEAAQLPTVLEAQAENVAEWARAQGINISEARLQDYGGQIMSGIGTLTTFLGGVIGAITTVIIIVIIGVYVVAEPRLYERGAAWMVPRERRDTLYVTLGRMAYTLRRLLAGRLVGMAFEGAFTYVLLAYGGYLIGIDPVPLAGLLAILTGLLAFVPNIGALISGALMVTVGFSGGWDMGLYTVFVYLFVQNFDGYVVIPMIARKTVDLAPALVLAFQLIMGILFGILGLFLADPLLAMIKVALERRAEQKEEEARARMEEHLDASA
jgi:predicted PurR-regulated permease PerM